MSGLLRALGWVVLLTGVGTAVVAGVLFVLDAGFADIAAAYGRHPEHPIFQAQYWAAAVRHYGLLIATIGGLLGGLTAGGLLLGVAELLRRQPERRRD